VTDDKGRVSMDREARGRGGGVSGERETDDPVS